MHRPMTASEEKSIRGDYNNGISVRQLCKTYRRSHHTIEAIVETLQQDKPKHKGFMSIAEVVEICKRTGKSYGKVVDAMRKGEISFGILEGR